MGTTIEQAMEYYKQSPAPKKGGEWVYNPDFDECRLAVGRSFAGLENVKGDPVQEWGVNHISTDWYTNEDNQLAAAFGIGLSIYVGMKSNNLLIAKRFEGKIVSAAMIAEYDPNKKQSMWESFINGWRYYMAIFKMLTGKHAPKLFMDSSHREDADKYGKKMTDLEAYCKKIHVKYGPKEKHWMIKFVGVDPSYNGIGFGRELMELIHSLADKLSMDCYLECGTYNIGFYKKLGYSELAREMIPDSVDAESVPLELCLMLRRHQS